MKYTLVYCERDNGYNWYVRNSEGLYAAWIGGNTYIRGWTSAEQASDYMEKHLQADCVWAPWPETKLPIRNVTTAVSYKPPHGGYPDAAAAGPASIGSVTGRIPSKLPAIAATYDPAEHMRQRGAEQRARMASQQPLVLPVIPPHDDGSNEEASTVSEALVQAMA